MREGLRRVCQRSLKLIVFGCLVAGPASAQSSGRIIARDGWEAFPRVQYEGGDATQPKRLWGVLVLTDSTVALHPCGPAGCFAVDQKVLFLPTAYFTINLRSVTGLRGTPPPDRGQSGEKEEFLGVVYETPASVEVPIFRFDVRLGGVAEEKIRFRLKKLGVALPERTP